MSEPGFEPGTSSVDLFFLRKKYTRGGSDLDPGQFMFRRKKATFKVVVHGISEENPHTVNLPHKALCQKLQGDANRREGERLDMHRKASLLVFLKSTILSSDGLIFMQQDICV
ncbi:hypothetical protein Peur_059697 [Populus x canadensis]